MHIHPIGRFAAALACAAPITAHASVLLVGSYHGVAGGFTTIQAAVAAAKPGDWILVGPGDYHEQATANAGVFITTHNLHLRGMDRNAVVVDGTAPGSRACSARPQDQVSGPAGGRNGIVVEKTFGVSIENLTACNYLSDPGGAGGNEIWWNGGDGSGVIGLSSWYGAYLTASSTVAKTDTGAVPQYGIFVSNANGPGRIEYSYASNMANSAFYVGACRDCNAVLSHVVAENSALGYSGTNAGGHLRLEDSEWAHNRVGIVPSSLANDDPPSPQDGSCPNDTAKSCTLIQRNYVHDNNNPNTPYSLGNFGPPVGTGIELTGSRNDTVRNNLVTRNGAWGILVNDYADPTPPAIPTYCQGGIVNFQTPAPYDQLLGAVVPCYFYAYGNRVYGNFLSHNGFFGNVTNGDLANLALPQSASNCYFNNTDPKTGAPSSAPLSLQTRCSAAWNPDTGQLVTLFEQVLCDAFGPGSGLCSGPGYPQTTAPRTIPIPIQAGLTDPCAGVPANNWCPANVRR